VGVDEAALAAPRRSIKYHVNESLRAVAPARATGVREALDLLAGLGQRERRRMALPQSPDASAVESSPSLTARGFSPGITCGIFSFMAMTLRLDEQETEALRLRAQREGRSMQEVARQAVRDYIERTSRRDLLDGVLDEEIPRYAEALRRLGE
jgi:hypothetical protein